MCDSPNGRDIRGKTFKAGKYLDQNETIYHSFELWSIWILIHMNGNNSIDSPVP